MNRRSASSSNLTFLPMRTGGSHLPPAAPYTRAGVTRRIAATSGADSRRNVDNLRKRCTACEKRKKRQTDRTCVIAQIFADGLARKVSREAAMAWGGQVPSAGRPCLVGEASDRECL